MFLVVIWQVFYSLVLRPLLPHGDTVGIVMIAVFSAGILAVPVVSAFHRRKHRDKKRHRFGSRPEDRPGGEQ
ncbi:hypothetical protein F9C11_21960 [Amycolatopsis sp. VS8301801F10]|uniref:hypothetical protein n=1 Tax=Amycolatopsis sp. VS8301801F10 TaxID=2652442 RepID=UPI0038FCE378